MIEVDLHEAQMQVINERKRFNVVRCGRRWGKSFLAFALALEQLLIPHSIVLYTTPTYEDLVKRQLEAVTLFSQLGATSKEGLIQLGSSRLEFAGLHRFDGLRGNKYHRVLGDEWAHSVNAETAWNNVIRPTLTDYKGDGYFFSTPKGTNHFHYLDSRSLAMTDWQSFHFPTNTNPHIDPYEIELARQELPSLVFQQEYLAEYISLEGARIKREWLKYTTDTSGEVTIGVDLAISQKETADYTALVAVAKRGNEYVIVDAIRGRWTFVEQFNAIQSIANKWNAKKVAVESVQYQAAMVQELRRNTNLPVVEVKVTKDKVTRFTAVEGKFEHGYILLAKGLPPTFEDELLSFPNAQHDDYCDALVHAVNAHNSVSPLLYIL